MKNEVFCIQVFFQKIGGGGTEKSRGVNIKFILSSCFRHCETHGECGHAEWGTLLYCEGEAAGGEQRGVVVDVTHKEANGLGTSQWGRPVVLTPHFQVIPYKERKKSSLQNLHKTCIIKIRHATLFNIVDIFFRILPLNLKGLNHFKNELFPNHFHFHTEV